ncbi:general substrate transporter [Xylariales sp. PMI_506]|nr:general substrate transporter [Xylariales sp. PMI_506]
MTLGGKKDVSPQLAAVLPQDGIPWYRKRHLVVLNLLLIVPLLSSSTIGYDGSMMNGLQTLSQWNTYFHSPSAPLLGAINALYPVGKIIGLFPVAWLGDRYGRKVPIMIGLGLLISTAIFQAASQNTAWFIASRFLVGVATVFVAQPSPILITELAFPTHRGKMTAMYNTSYYLGAILAAWTTYGTFRLQSTWSWRIPSALQAAYPIIQCLFVYWLPESPRWLTSKGRTDEARQFLIKYHAGGDASSPLVDMEMREIEEYILLEKQQASSEISYLDLIRTAPNRRRTLIAVITGLGAQWNGISVVSYYLTLVLDTIGITTTEKQALINGLLQLFNFAAAVFGGALMVDRLGRRTLFLIGTGGLCLSYICWTALTAQFVMTNNAAYGNAVVVFIFVAYFFYDIAWTPLLYSYPVEIFPFALRSRGMVVTMNSAFVGLVASQLINPVALKAVGWKYYIAFCCIIALLFTLVFFLFPETKGRTLEEIAEVFDGPAGVPDVEAITQKSETEAAIETKEFKADDIPPATRQNENKY